MSRIRSIIFMLCSASIFMSIYAGDIVDADAAQEQTPEQQQQETAPEAAPKKEEVKPETQTAPEDEPEVEPEVQPQDEAVDATEDVTEELVSEVVEAAPSEEPKAVDITEEPQIEIPETEPAATPDEFEGEKVVVLGPTEEESVPLPPEPAEEPMVEDLEAVEHQGIDTVDISEPKGNWLYKRIKRRA